MSSVGSLADSERMFHIRLLAGQSNAPKRRPRASPALFAKSVDSAAVGEIGMAISRTLDPAAGGTAV